MNKWPISRQVFALSLILCALAFGGLIVAVVMLSNRSVVEVARNNLATQVNLVANTLTYAQDSLKRNAQVALRVFERQLPGGARLSGKDVATGSAELPEIQFGNLVANGNLELLRAYREANPGQDPAVLVRKGDALYRAATLLKDPQGKSRNGEVVPDAYTKTVLAGQDYVGTLERSGKMYALAVHPLKDSAGTVIGAITLRLDAEDNVALLKAKLKEVVVGRTGYVFVVSEPVGDQKDIRFVMHPSLEGKSAGDLPPNLRKVIETIVEKRNGDHYYEYPDASGALRDKVIVFHELPELHWIVAAGSFVDEFTASNEALRNSVIAACVVLGLLMAALFYGLVARQLAPLSLVAQAMGRFGSGDLTVRLQGEAGSRNEIHLLNVRVNESVGQISGLVGSIKGGADQVRDSAASLSHTAQEVLGAIEQQRRATAEIAASTDLFNQRVMDVGERAALARGLAEQAVSQVQSGKNVALHAITAMRNVEGQVRASLTEVERLTQESQAIERVVQAIKTIADQTNLLALNAAIEAARAGEAGRGFAVVADEVRKLAEEAGKSTGAIGEILSRIAGCADAVSTVISGAVAEAGNGAEASAQAEVALEEIQGYTRRMAEAIGQIVEASDEQARVAQHITQQLDGVNRSADDTGVSARRNVDTAEGLQSVAEGLEREVSHFRMG